MPDLPDEPTAPADRDAAAAWDAAARARAEAGHAAVAPPDRRHGFTAGHYVVTARIGIGGMGIVYAAYDPRLDRRVALKLMHGAAGQSDGFQRRFEQEARALATLSHPNVVTIYDVGFIAADTLAALDDDDAVPAIRGAEPRRVMYIAMEYIDGTSLAAWSAAAPRSWREVLAVLAQAGAGLQAVHDAGLVHRDVKPDNIMVGNDGRVRVMDFGLARDQTPGKSAADTPALADALEDSQLTVPGSVVGTPAYMAPEQHIGGPIDARTDQFGFCVTAWEALHGQRPFAATNRVELATSVLEGRLRPLDAATRRLSPAWVRAVLERGLAVDAAERWPEMRALLAALGRDPARARRRWLAVGGVTLAIAGAAATSAWEHQRRIAACDDDARSAEQAWTDRRVAVADAFVATGRDWARDSHARLEPVVEGWTAAWAHERGEVCRDRLAGTLANEVADERTACLDRELERFVDVVDLFAGIEAESLRRALPAAYALPAPTRCRDRAWLAATTVHDDAMARDDAEQRAAIDRAAALALLGRFPDAVAAGDVALARARAAGRLPRVAQLLAATGEWTARAGDPNTGAVRLYEAYYLGVRTGADDTAVTAATQLVTIVGIDLGRLDDGEAWARQAAALVDRLGDGDGARGLSLLEAVAQLDRRRGAYAAARRSQQQLVARRIELLGEDHPSVADAYSDLGTTLEEMGRAAQAEHAFRRCLDIRANVLGEDHPDYAAAQLNLALALDLDRPLEAVALYREALARLERERGPNHPDVAIAAFDLGSRLGDLGAMDEALALLDRAYAIRLPIFGPHHLDVASIWFTRGRLARLRGDLDAADDALDRAQQVFEAVGGDRQPFFGLALKERANVAFVRGRFDESLALLRRAAPLLAQVYGPSHHHTLSAAEDTGAVLRDLGRYDEAIPLLEASLARRELEVGATSAVLVNPMVVLGNARAAAGDIDRAAIDLERALAIAQARLPPGDESRSYAIDSVAELDLRRGRRLAAELRLRQSVAETRATRGADHPALAYAETTLGEVLLARGEAAAAAEVLSAALARREGPAADAIELATTRFALARARWAVGHHREARALATLAVAGFATVTRGRPAEQHGQAQAWLVAHP